MKPQIKPNNMDEVVELLLGAKKILVVSHREPTGDSLGSMLAMKEGLVGMSKSVLAIQSDIVPKAYSFMPGVAGIDTELTGTRDLIIDINTASVKPESVKYDTLDDTLRITVSPKDGEFGPDHVSLTRGTFQFDLIVVLDTPDVASLDNIYDQESELFHQVPVVNIDHHQSNESFGSVNYIDEQASSTAEIVYGLLKKLGAELSADMATNLLTGVITNTHGFKRSQTSANTLRAASDLVGIGADQTLINKNTFGTKPTSQLKLWGRVLARLEENQKLSLVYSSISHQDFIDCGASTEQIKGIVDELLSHTNAKIILLLIEREPGLISVRIRSLADDSALRIARAFEGSGTSNAAGFELENLKITDATKLVLSKVDEILGKQEQEIRNVDAPFVLKPESRPRIKPVFDEPDDQISEPGE